MNYIKGTNKIDKSSKLQSSFLENSTIGKDCEIFGSTLKNCVIKNKVKIVNSVLENCVVCDNSKIGPFAYLRQNAFIGKNCRIGDFVEVKNSFIDDFSKSAHHSYIGDCFIGKHCNIGCGVVFANFNGKIKQKTLVGDNTFIGANVNLVAPLKIGKNCFIGAGTTIRKNLKDNTFVVDHTNNKEKSLEKKIDSCC